MKFKKFKNAPIDLICHETSSQIFYKWIPISFVLQGDGSCQHVVEGHGSSTTHKNVHDINLATWCIQRCGTSITCMEMTSW